MPSSRFGSTISWPASLLKPLSSYLLGHSGLPLEVVALGLRGVSEDQRVDLVAQVELEVAVPHQQRGEQVRVAEDDEEVVRDEVLVELALQPATFFVVQ